MTVRERRPGDDGRGGAREQQNGNSEGKVSNRGVPLLAAYRDGRSLLVWCEHEQCWHTHGSPPGTGAGPRVAHCVCQAAREQRPSYILAEVGRFTAAVRRAHGPELAYSRRCRADSCRFTRSARRAGAA